MIISIKSDGYVKDKRIQVHEQIQRNKSVTGLQVTPLSADRVVVFPDWILGGEDHLENTQRSQYSQKCDYTAPRHEGKRRGLESDSFHGTLYDPKVRR